MIECDVNYFFIIIWSNGNEGGWNYNLDFLFVKYDKLQKCYMVYFWVDFNDLDIYYYFIYLIGVVCFINGYKVFMFIEFMYVMYDQGGGVGLCDFWDCWCMNFMFVGGFIWVFCDEVFKCFDKGGILDFDKFNVFDGVVGLCREKEGSYYVICV